MHRVTLYVIIFSFILGLIYWFIVSPRVILPYTVQYWIFIAPDIVFENLSRRIIDTAIYMIVSLSVAWMIYYFFKIRLWSLLVVVALPLMIIFSWPYLEYIKYGKIKVDSLEWKGHYKSTFNNWEISFSYPDNWKIWKDIKIEKHGIESYLWEILFHFADLSNDEWSYPPNKNVWRDVYDIYNEWLIEQNNILLWYKKWFPRPSDKKFYNSYSNTLFEENINIWDLNIPVFYTYSLEDAFLVCPGGYWHEALVFIDTDKFYSITLNNNEITLEWLWGSECINSDKPIPDEYTKIVDFYIWYKWNWIDLSSSNLRWLQKEHEDVMKILRSVKIN